jgi:hypothetical protein
VSDFGKEGMCREDEDIKTSRNEASSPTTRLMDLLNHINITNPPVFRIKRVLRPGREEYKAMMEILNGPNVIGHHKGLAFRAMYQDAVANAAW